VVSKERINIWATVKNKQLFRLNWGIFTLHALLMSSFVVVPGILEGRLGIAREDHWLVYLLILVGSFLCMMPLITRMEKRNWVKRVFLFSIIALALSLSAFALFLQTQLLPLAWLMLFGFFVAFNLLEATLPSLVNKLAPKKTRGAALGIYSTSQFLGTFVGGVVGGYASETWGPLVALLISASMALLWLIVASGMKVSPPPVLTQTPGVLP
jgi:predicted MFS family arabinose efflux permease